LFDLTPSGIAPFVGETPKTGFSSPQYNAAVEWKFEEIPDTDFVAAIAEITLTAKEGFTFAGVAENAFTYSGVDARQIISPAGQGKNLLVMIIFPLAVPRTVITFALDSLVTAPVRGAVPYVVDINADQYTGTIAWKTPNGEHSGNFAGGTVYIAELTLSGYSRNTTFTGVPENAFTYSGASVTNPAGQGSSLVVTITFPPTSSGQKITVTSTEGLSQLLTGHVDGNSVIAPIDLTAALELSEANWSALLSEIGSGGKYVSLDLAACTPSDSNILGGLRPNGDFAPMQAFSMGKDKIVHLTLPVQASGIVAGLSALTPTFKNFSALKTVSGEGIRTIGSYAFYECFALASVSAPAAKSIGNNAFYGCISLASVSLPAAESIGARAFYGCSVLASVSAPAAESIGDYVFSRCSALASVSLPAAKSIGDYAFSIDGVGYYSGYFCTALTSVSLPAAESIGDYAFLSCTALTSVSLPVVGSIGEEAFRNCTRLTSVSLPAAESIGSRAFFNCTALASVSAPAAESIGNNAFYGCDALASVSLPAAKSIGSWAFDSDSLTSVSLPAVESIGIGAFGVCNALTSVTIPASLSKEAFYNAYFEGHKIVWTLVGSGGFTTLENGKLLIYNGDTLVHGSAASGNITLPNTITSIGSRAFLSCTALTSISAPAVTSIGSTAFSGGCTALTSVSLPAAESIGGAAFVTCDALTSIILGATPPTLGDSILSGVSANITVRIPSGSEGAYGAASYSNSSADSNNWGNGLRGKGWGNDTYMGERRVNTDINLFFETYNP
jgi:hypothetical protein